MLFHLFVGIPIQEQILDPESPLQVIYFDGKRFLGMYSQPAESFCVTEIAELVRAAVIKLKGVAFRNIQSYQATPVIIPEILIG